MVHPFHACAWRCLLHLRSRPRGPRPRLLDPANSADKVGFKQRWLCAAAGWDLLTGGEFLRICKDRFSLSREWRTRGWGRAGAGGTEQQILPQPGVVANATFFMCTRRSLADGALSIRRVLTNLTLLTFARAAQRRASLIRARRRRCNRRGGSGSSGSRRAPIHPAR